nr:MAG TPA: lytic transglycosylase, bacteriophage, phiKZ, endolysin, peptidoglycan.5A [Caudoviricetes sp.]
MAIEWKPIEGGFGSVMETALAQSKQLAPQQIDITQGFGGRFVTPEEYYTAKNNAALSALDIEPTEQTSALGALAVNKQDVLSRPTQEVSPSSVASSISNVVAGTPNKGKYSALYGDNFNKYAPMIVREAQAQGVDPNTLLSMTYIESKFDPNAANSAYGGLHQISKSQHSKWADPEYNTREALKLYKANEAYARKQGITFDVGNAYLFHQQGLGGATALLKNPNLSAAEALKKTSQWKNKDVAWINKNVIEANGGRANMSATEFANLWRNKANEVYANVRGREAQLGGWANYLNNRG